MRLFLLLLLLSAVSTAASFKKWVDENGVVHYGTTIPPQYVGREHSELNSRGIEVDRVERARTAEEIAQEKELARLRAKQKKLLDEQQARDRLLLYLYRNEDDLLLERDGKLAQVDNRVALKQKQIERLKQRLTKWQAMAADAERRGSRLTKKQQANLDVNKQQIESAYSDIVDLRSDRLKIENRYARDLVRLKQLRSTQKLQQQVELEGIDESEKTSDVQGTLLCSDAEQCKRLWPMAREYVKRNATTPIQVIGPRILMTRQPQDGDDISLTLSRLSTKDQERLFLDVQCQNSVSGRALCESDAVQSIRGNFRDFLLAQDK